METDGESCCDIEYDKVPIDSGMEMSSNKRHALFEMNIFFFA